MSNKKKYALLAVNLAGFLIVANACGGNFWTAMLGVVLIDCSARALGSTTLYGK